MNFSGSEMILVAILALVLLGPKKLPEVARQIGRAVAEVRKYSKEFEREIRDAIEPIEKEVREVERHVRDAETEARKAYALDDDFSSFEPKPTPTPELPEQRAE